MKNNNLFDEYREVKDLADYFEEEMISRISNHDELIEFVKKYLRSYDVPVIELTGSNSNQVIDFIKQMEKDPDRVYYICYLITNTLRAASMRFLRNYSINNAGNYS